MAVRPWRAPSVTSMALQILVDPQSPCMYVGATIYIVLADSNDFLGLHYLHFLDLHDLGLPLFSCQDNDIETFKK